MANRAHVTDFASRLAMVLGIGSIATACGGKVIFEQSGGTGTGGGGGKSSTSVGSTGHGTSATVGVSVGATSSSSGGGCNVPGPPGDQLQNVCFKVGANICPTKVDPNTKLQTEEALNVGVTGCNQKVVDLVACGPDAPTGQCCYWVYTHPKCITGRPFSVEGEARTAELMERPDWMNGPVSSVAELEGDTRSRLAEAWANDGLGEHASIASFARFALELLSVGAPADLVRDAQAAMGDEIRHAELSFALASAYAGRAIGPSPMPVEGAVVGRTLAEIAAATVREGCVNETIAAILAAEARDGATDECARAALEVIAADEARHAELAWRTVAWAMSTGDAGVRASVERAFEEALAATENAAQSGVQSGSEITRAHGQISPSEKARVQREALLGVIRPTAHALLAKLGRPGHLAGSEVLPAI